MGKAAKLDMTAWWQAYILHDLTTGQRIGIYGARHEADADVPGWHDKGMALTPCEIRLVKRHR